MDWPATWKQKMALISLALFYLISPVISNSHPFLVEANQNNSRYSQESPPIILSRRALFDDLDLDIELAGDDSIIEPHSDDQPEARYRNPFPFAFNGGKPFSLEKDPITGQIDLAKAPPLKAVNLTDQLKDEEFNNSKNQEEESDSQRERLAYLERESVKNKDIALGPNEINPYSPSFHDFLNLPIHYSSDKYDKSKYPLISSSYANTKVQSGSNLYSIHNHKLFDESSTDSSSSNPIAESPTTRTRITSSTARPTTISSTTSTLSTTQSSTVTSRISTTTPSITTWKPQKTTNSYKEYEDAFSIEKLQTSNNDNILLTSSSEATNLPEYVYEYEDVNDQETMNDHEESYYSMDSAPSDRMTSSTPRIKIEDPDVVSASSTRSSEASPPSVTSMPLDSTDNFKDSTYENVVEGQRPVSLNTISSPGHVYFPHSFVERPIGTGAMLPESTSNILVPPYQDTVSFVLGNRQNVESNYYTHGSPTGENTYSTIIGKGSFRPLIGSSGQQQSESAQDDRVTIGLPSVSVVDYGVAKTQEWYKPKPVESSADSISSDSIPIPSVSSNSQSSNSIINSNFVTNSDSVSNLNLNSALIPNYNPDLSSVSNFNSGSVTNPIHNSKPGSVSSFASDFGSIPNTNSNLVSVPGFESNSGSIPNLNYNPPPIQDDSNSHFGSADPQISRFPSQISQNSHQLTNSPITNEIDPSRIRPNSAIGGIQHQSGTNERREEQNKGYVVFPGAVRHSEPQRPIEEHVVVINEADGNIREFTSPPSPSLTNQQSDFNSNKESNGPPQPAEELLPPAERPRLPIPGQRPPLHFHHQHPPSRPLSRGPPPSPSKPASVDMMVFKRRPGSPDAKLPNILPQFRPNSKSSYGHRGPESIGTLPATHIYHNRPRPPVPFSNRRPSPPSSYLQRLTPPYPPGPHQGHHIQRTNNNISRDDLVAQNSDIAKRKRHPSQNPQDERQGHFPIPVVKKQNTKSDRIEHFSAEPPQTPPRPILFPRHRTTDNSAPKVATLQMIQQHGGLEGDFVRSNLPPPLRDSSKEEKSGNERDNQADSERRKDDFSNTDDPDSPLYVVYPVNTALNIDQDDSKEKDESVVVGTRGPHRPLPPETLLQKTGDNSETASILSLPSKHYSDPAPVLVPDFPYPLEKPDPALLSNPVQETPLLVPSSHEQDKKDTEDKHNKDSNLNIIPYLQDFVPFAEKKKNNTISTTLHRLPLISNFPSSTPIAYVFTPTPQPAIQHLNLDFDHEVSSNYERDEKKPILLPSQQPSSSSSSAPSPQNFMAPFIASANAEASQKNGWNVVLLDFIDRSSTDEENKEKNALTAEETQTERNEFDPDNFKPQLFGGFKPIYEFPSEEEKDEIRDEKVQDTSQNQEEN